MEHSRQATAAQSAVAQTTNELLKKNADMLKMGTIATAKEAERSIVDIETLQHTNEQLVSTLDEVVNIQREGAQKRKEAEVELGRIEGELKQKLMELRAETLRIGEAYEILSKTRRRYRRADSGDRRIQCVGPS